MDQDLSKNPSLPPDPPPMDAGGEPPGGDSSAADAAINVAFELLASATSNSILMAPVWCGKVSPQAEQYSFGIARKVLINLVFSAVLPGHEMEVLEEFFQQTRIMAKEYVLLAGEAKGNA